jgi:hypothetical protein
MEIVFTNIQPNGQMVLEKWIAELRGSHGDPEMESLQSHSLNGTVT